MDYKFLREKKLYFVNHLEFGIQVGYFLLSRVIRYILGPRHVTIDAHVVHQQRDLLPSMHMLVAI